jgi:anthranilate phosphoribosyltransferase
MTEAGVAARSIHSADLIDFMAALSSRVRPLEPVAGESCPVLLPAYGGTRRLPNLTALVALLLRRYGVPVVVHGPAEAASEFGRITTAAILWELGIEPAVSLAEAQQRLVHERIAYVPLSLLAPGIFELLAVRSPPDLRGDLRGVAQLIDPFGGAALRVVGASHAGDWPLLREFFTATRANALLMPATEGEPFANPRRQPRLESFMGGIHAVQFDAAEGPPAALPGLPRAPDAAATAAWITAALEGEQPVPLPIVNQLACCLLATRRAPCVA